VSYFYETHFHTKETSRCGFTAAAEMIVQHKNLGFSGVFVTDHFLTGHSHANERLSFERRVDIMQAGYSAAKKKGDEIGLDVFFAWEYPYHCGDFLTYGLSVDFLYTHRELMDFEPNHDFAGYAKLVHDNGGYIIQAHPFRVAEYMPNGAAGLQKEYIDAIEVDNGSHHNPAFNEAALRAAKKLRMPMSAGSDTHGLIMSATAYMGFDHLLKDSQDFIAQMKAGKYKLLHGQLREEDFI